jgi:choline-sulfatase
MRNVIVIMSDEHDPRHMGCSGSPVVKTPALDTLAAQSVRFTQAYTPSPICVPARAAFATGRWVHQLRLWDNAMPYTGEPNGWGHMLQQAGVRVESIGKLHYRDSADPTGFDAEHIPMHVAGGHGMVWGSIRAPYYQRPDGGRMLGAHIGEGESPYTQYDESVTRQACEWLHDAAQRGEDFVLYVGLVAPHFPLVVAPQYFRHYAEQSLPAPKLHPNDGHMRHPWVQAQHDFMPNEDQFASAEERHAAFAAYYGLCTWLDHNVGQILQALTQAGLDDNTTVIYTSDHGDNLGARGMWGKSTLYQESVAVPMLLRAPGLSPGVCDTPVSLVDLHPTILHAAGLPAHSPTTTLPSTSLQTLAQAPTDAERPVLSEYHAVGSNSAGFMLRQGRWKYHHYVGHAPELFDLYADPQELHDLASDTQHQTTRQAMETRLREILDPEATDALAKQDQRDLIRRVGGLEVAKTMGAKAATPAPTASTR